MSNIIKQLQDADGNNIFPLAYAMGGVKMDVVFDNSNHGTTYAGTTVSANFSNYDYFIAEYDFYHTNSAKGYIFGIVGGGPTRMYFMTDSSTTNLNVSYRNITVTSSSIVIGDGTKGNTGTDNARCIPYKVYGIKFSWVVPTSVQGLQYVEV